MNSCIPETAYAIIIGSMKCGTSSLYSYMVQHPEICGARVKEPEFFSESQHHGVKVEKYSDLWDFDPKQHKIALEASTGYTKYPSEKNVPKNILSYGIRPKLIYIIRNPFDRIQSHFEFMSHYGSWKLNLLDEHLINTSNYFLQLAQYLNYFARDQILVLDFDDLKVDPTPLLNRTFQFLGLHPIVLSQDNITENRTQPLSGAERKLKRWGRRQAHSFASNLSDRKGEKDAPQCFSAKETSAGSR